jgi:23S rRNA (guanosine2251-2'-O)-methyltransferase
VTRRQLAGEAEIAAALARGEALRLLLVRRDAPRALRLLTEHARERGVAVRETSANDLRRMSRTREPCDVLALIGPDPDAPLAEVLARPGCAWLLVDVAYPGNAGYAIRSAEVSGAEGIFIDAAMDAAGRRQAQRASMYADRFFPVQWLRADAVLDAARSARRRVLAIEDSGTTAPWDADLCGPVLFVIGGETRGIPAPVLERCDTVLRIPMAGFIPAYNLQAAMAAVAAERLRQTHGS